MKPFNPPSHMNGWEAFTAVNGVTETVTVRELAGGDGEDWPDGEVHEGVAAIQVHIYGDHAGGAFVSVCGPDRDAVKAALDRVTAAIEGGVGLAWIGGKS